MFLLTFGNWFWGTTVLMFLSTFRCWFWGTSFDVPIDLWELVLGDNSFVGSCEPLGTSSGGTQF